MAERRPPRLVFCEHCHENVSRRTYYQHRRMFYNRTTEKWSQTRVFNETLDPVFTISDTQPHSSIEDRLPSSDVSLSDESQSDTDDEMNKTTNEGEGTDDDTEDGQIELLDTVELDEDLVVKENPQQTVELDEDLVVKENPQQTMELTTEWEATDQGQVTPLLQLYIFFLFMFQGLFRMSDIALNVLLKFLSIFFRTISQTLVALPQCFLDNLPTNLYSARLGTKNDFKKYVVCPNCRSLYDLDKCVIRCVGHRAKSGRCSYIRFPNHTQLQHRHKCKTVLMKEVKYRSGAVSFYPKFVYCYKSLIDSLQEMLLQPGFFSKCQLWRSRPTNTDTYSDVYDGAVWKQFQTYDGHPFLSLTGNLAFQLNVDWFNPFKHTQHSEGAIYLSILNLPRTDRYLQENIILVGVIPGPKEPPLHLNTFLEPLVKDLKKLWTGVLMKSEHGHTLLIRGALLCCTSDIPASRKVCGFMGHAATKGCSKCLLSFPTNSFGDKADYSNFDKTQWTKRTIENHRRKAEEYSNCCTLKDQKTIERNDGLRYTILLELPYFNPIQMCVIDPMHNLLLGTCRHIVEIWKAKSFLSSKDFDDIQEKVDSFVCPADVGRIPSKLSSKFSGITAEQWKNWVIYFSLYALKDTLPWRHYKCWQLFVKICCLLCQRSVTEKNLDEADELLRHFWEDFVDLYGKDSCTINMHLHGHLTQCIREYGPVYSFWCFSFERMNGILGSYHTNNHHVSIQYMRKFLDSKRYSPLNWPKEFAEEYFPLLQPFVYHKGSLMQSNVETEIGSGQYDALPPLKEGALSPSQKTEIMPHLLRQLEANAESVTLYTLYKQTKCLSIGRYVLGCQGSRHSKSSFVLAQRSFQSRDNIELAEILFFVECVATYRQSDTSKHTKMWFACVNYYLEHPCKLWYGHPVQVWTTVKSPETHLIPVNFIKSRVVYVKCTRDFGQALISDTVYVISPLQV